MLNSINSLRSNKMEFLTHFKLNFTKMNKVGPSLSFLFFYHFFLRFSLFLLSFFPLFLFAQSDRISLEAVNEKRATILLAHQGSKDLLK